MAASRYQRKFSCALYELSILRGRGRQCGHPRATIDQGGPSDPGRRRSNWRPTTGPRRRWSAGAMDRILIESHAPSATIQRRFIGILLCYLAPYRPQSLYFRSVDIRVLPDRHWGTHTPLQSVSNIQRIGSGLIRFLSRILTWTEY